MPRGVLKWLPPGWAWRTAREPGTSWRCEVKKSLFLMSLLAVFVLQISAVSAMEVQPTSDTVAAEEVAPCGCGEECKCKCKEGDGTKCECGEDCKCTEDCKCDCAKKDGCKCKKECGCGGVK